MTALRLPSDPRQLRQDGNSEIRVTYLQSTDVCMCGALALSASIRNHQCSNSLLLFHSNSILKADVMALVLLRLLGRGNKRSLDQQSLTAEADTLHWFGILWLVCHDGTFTDVT